MDLELLGQGHSVCGMTLPNCPPQRLYWFSLSPAMNEERLLSHTLGGWVLITAKVKKRRFRVISVSVSAV